MTQVLEKVAGRNIEESELIAGGVSPPRVSKYFNIMQHMSTRCVYAVMERGHLFDLESCWSALEKS